MRNSLIAVFVAAAIASVLRLLSEPNTRHKSSIPQPDAVEITRPSVKGDRLDVRPLEACSQLDVGDCDRRQRQPAERPSSGPVILVKHWSI